MHPPSSTTPPCPNTPYRDAQLIHAGKGYGLMYSVWARFRDILDYGPTLTETNPQLLSPLNRTYREGYLNLLSIEPKISDLVTNRPLHELTSQLDKGRNEFRNSQVHAVRDRISSWGIGVPEDKLLRGFGNDICGRLLCPPNHDWEDPTTREQIRLFQISVTADDFPRFLWEGEQVDLRDLKKGFLRGELLVKALLSILIGPAAACPGGQSNGAGGYADLFNLQTMTIPSLAFAATVVGASRGFDDNTGSLIPQARHALSAESTCRWAFRTGSPGFNNMMFYQRVISTIESWKTEEQRSLLLWWNRMILSHLRGGVHSASLSDAPIPGSAAAMMLQQAANAGAGPH